MESTSTPPPVVCTLTLGKRAERELEWSDVAELAIDTTKIPGGIEATFPANLTDQLRDLVDRETACCGTWLTSTLTTDGDLIRLSLTTENPEGLKLISAMAATS